MIAASATGGALVAFGMGLQHPWLPFNLAAHVLLGVAGSAVNELHPRITPVGIFVHLTALMIWALLFALLIGRRRLVTTMAAAAAFSAIVFALNTRLFPVGLRPGYESVLTAGQMVFLHFLLAVMLVLGIRLAFSSRVVT